MSQTIEQLKQIQADAQSMFTKMHNYHWNVKGMDFYPVHNQTESIYNSYAKLYDDAAERTLQLGGTPYVTMKEIITATKIEEETRTSFNSKEIVHAIIKEFKYFKSSFEALRGFAEKDLDNTTVAFADENIASLEKELWILGNMIK